MKSNFDEDEYLHLALHASSVRNYHACIGYLKELLDTYPNNARALYLLAVQYAELGLLERAIAGLKSALSIDASLETARLQLGVLLLDRQQNSAAKQQFAQLSASKDQALRICSEAMILLSDKDTTSAKLKLTSGLHNNKNSALTGLMRRLLAKLSRDDHPTTDEVNGIDAHVKLGAYESMLKQ